MKKITFIFCMSILLAVCNSNNSFAQANYNTAAGLRIGSLESGLNFKHFTNNNTAFEGIIGFSTGVFILTGLYEKHAIAFADPSLNWVYGIGIHLGRIKGGYYRVNGVDNYFTNSGLILGADAIGGLEWTVPEIPLALSADLHPRVNLARGSFLNLEAALSVRYTF